MAPTTPGPSPATIDSLVSGLAAQPPISLTYEELVGAALLAQFSDKDAAIMAAISTMETSRNALAVSGRGADGNRAWGAFAVSLPDNKVQDAGWMVPTTNAGQAKVQLDNAGLQSWPSYASGAYLAAMPQAQMALAQVVQRRQAATPPYSTLFDSIALPPDLRTQLAGVALQWQSGIALVPTVGTGANAIGQLGAAGADATVQGVFKPFGSVLDFLNALGNPGTWVRIAYALVGGALIVVALRQVAADR